MDTKVAVYGLGSMGYGIAQSCARAGHQTWGVDVREDAMNRFRGDGGQAGSVPTNALDVAIIVVLNAAQAEAVMIGPNRIVPAMRAGSVVIACPTVPPDFARAMAARCAEHGVHYLDAPISGGSVKAAQGALSVMASGTEDAFAAAEPALDAMAETVFRLGNEAGAGSAMKAVNQLLAGVHIAAMAEGLTFGVSQGIDPQAFLDTISQCAGSSWMLENRAPHIVAGDYTPHSAVNIWLKDLGIVLDIAKQSGFSAPVTATALQQFVAAAGSGLGQEDDSAVAKIYARNAGLRLPGQD